MAIGIQKPWNFAAWGNKRIVYTTITGDGSATVVNVPVRPEHAWVSLDAGSSSEATTWDAQLTMGTTIPYTVTYGTAPSNGKEHTLFVIGTD